jgi:hypothetical protein
VHSHGSTWKHYEQDNPKFAAVNQAVRTELAPHFELVVGWKLGWMGEESKVKMRHVLGGAARGLVTRNAYCNYLRSHQVKQWECKSMMAEMKIQNSLLEGVGGMSTTEAGPRLPESRQRLAEGEGKGPTRLLPNASLPLSTTEPGHILAADRVLSANFACLFCQNNLGCIYLVIFRGAKNPTIDSAFGSDHPGDRILATVTP